MRVLAILAAFTLIAAPVLSAPGVAYADGIERPRMPRPPRHRPPPRPQAEAPPPAPIAPQGPETVTLSQAFFNGSAGGVGTDIGTGFVGGGTTVIVGGSAHASAFAFASASARSGGHFGGQGGCGCH